MYGSIYGSNNRPVFICLWFLRKLWTKSRKIQLNRFSFPNKSVQVIIKKGQKVQVSVSNAYIPFRKHFVVCYKCLALMNVSSIAKLKERNRNFPL